MNTRFSKVAKMTLLTTAGSVLLFAAAGWESQDSASSKSSGASAAAPAQTEDIIFTTDGRELHGKVLSETRTSVTFEFVDLKTKIKSTITLDKDKIAEIKKGVPVAGSPAAAAPAAGGATPAVTLGSTPSKPADKSKESNKGPNFVSRLGKDAKDVPSFYIVPIRGQVGTDVVSDTYKDIVADIKAVKPSLVVVKMDCKDKGQSFVANMSELNTSEMGLLDLDDGHVLAELFHTELRDVPQVIWINDSVGMSSVLAMSWDKIYMTPTSRLGGMVMVLAQSGAKGWADPDVRAKMYAAWTGGAKSILEFGGYSPVLADAMIDPEFMLSATLRGREVMWTSDTSGEYVIDAADDYPANFNSKMCEDFCISKGTAENLDDLALLLGYREYRMAEGNAEKIVSDYITDWRRAYDDAKDALLKYQQYMGWASGQDQVKYLGQAKAQLERALSAINRYKAVEKRLRADEGLDKMSLTLRIEEINSTLRQLKGANRTGGTGSGKGGSGAGRAGAGGKVGG